MARRGWRVVVLTSRDGYDDPSAHYLAREVLNGVEIVRLPWCSFGKSSIAIRVIGGLSFVVQAVFRSLAVRRIDRILVTTVPPMASLAALAIGWLRRATVKYWIMDLNPDQTVALGRLPPNALPVRLFNCLNRRILARADDVIVLDRFMARRVNSKRDVSEKLTVLPPWPLEELREPVPHSANPFRAAHGLEGKTVIMYSGNHGPSNPILTILQAASRLADEAQLVFLFVGGGVGKREVEAHAGPNVRSLPYQPLSQLRYSLSAADVHLVTLGDGMVGIVHPCKVYGAMAVARPILLVGPAPSHVADILESGEVGWRIEHGDVEGAERLLRQIARLPAEQLAQMGKRAKEIIDRQFSRGVLCSVLCDTLERGTRPM